MKSPDTIPDLINNDGQTPIDLVNDKAKMKVIIKNMSKENRPTIFQKFKSKDISNVVSPKVEMDC